MIKKLVYSFILCLIVCTSCKSTSRRIWHRSSSGQAGDAETEVPRDYSITKANAYNDIFLDSLAFEKYISSNSIADSVAHNMRDFYNVRNFQFAWFDSKGLAEQALGFRSLYKYKTDSINKSLDQRMDGLLLRESTISPTDPSILKTEFQLTQRFVTFLLDQYKDEHLNAAFVETFVPIKKNPILLFADSILSARNKEIEKYSKLNPAYDELRDQLAKYLEINKKGGWPTVPQTKSKYVLGKNFPGLLALKQRLAASGEFTAQDTTGVFTPELEAAIKDYQSTHGITADGKITTAFIKSVNVPVLNRIQQLAVNMERMRWMPTQKEGKLIVVNIPEFTLHVTDGNTHVQHMAVVVGKEGHNTTMFSDDLEYVVFSPYWNVPPSIVKAEILPGMSKNSNYLASKNMEITSNSGGLPSIRQRPGADNALGRVKFLFPNSFNIYLHDTPSKSLFDKDVRMFSHGCIRISDPVWMANYLLDDSAEWTPEKIEAAMNSGNEKTVKLKHSVPVIITYYTSWVDENKKLNFREDVYGLDKDVAAKMFSDNMVMSEQIAKK
jgi:murein L,D-transpeptidase YcbB/YkuD